MNDIQPPEPSGSGREAVFARWVWRRLTRGLIIRESSTVVADYLPGGISLRVKPSKGGAIGVKWASPRNYDHTKSYGAYELVYVQSSDSMIGTGTTDPDTMTTVHSTSGIWCSLQAVAPVVITMVTYYRIPHLPLPTPDDYDATNNYWVLFTPGIQCF